MLVQLGILSLARKSISTIDRPSYSCDTVYFYSDDVINSLAAMIGVLMPPVAVRLKISVTILRNSKSCSQIKKYNSSKLKRKDLSQV